MCRHACLLWALCMLGVSAHGQSASEEQDLALAFGDSATISVASGASQRLRRAPAVASVFTAEDIRASGATDLSQVLELVPGLHVARSLLVYDPQYQLRGVGSSFNQQILVLIDGIRRQNPHLGGQDELWVSMPVEQIERIEVIRGPGSALYGADAFSGVIAITTKRAAGARGGHARLSLGSHGERALSLQQGAQVGDWAWSAYLRAGRSDGPNPTVEADAQSALDALFGSHASLAPGPLHTAHRDLDAGVQLAWQELNLQAGLKQRKGVGSGAGLAQALSDRDRADSETAVLGLDYQRQGLLPHWDVQLHAALTRYRVDSLFVLFPAGAFGGAYPDGMQGGPGRSSRVAELSLGAVYGGWADHRLRWGAGLLDADMYASWEVKNFNFQFVPGVGNVPVPLGGLVSVPDSERYVLPQRRRVNYLLVQDEWSLAKDWTLTAGLRHDRYSDLGGTTNPRIALVWDAAYNLTLKALHGQAFRAPSFADLYNINNPVNIGNPKLRPERMRSSELVADWQAGAELHLVLNLFHYRMRDIVRLLPNADPLTGSTAANRGEQTGRGLEIEGRWQAGPALRLAGSYAYVHAIDGLSGQRSAEAPRHMLKLGADWRWGSDWAVNLQARHIADRARAAGDARAPIPDYTLLDLALEWRREAQQGWSLLLGLRNALDADAREPSPAPGNIPNDFPLPRRNWVVQAGYAF